MIPVIDLIKAAVFTGDEELVSFVRVSAIDSMLTLTDRFEKKAIDEAAKKYYREYFGEVNSDYASALSMDAVDFMKAKVSSASSMSLARFASSNFDGGWLYEKYITALVKLADVQLDIERAFESSGWKKADDYTIENMHFQHEKRPKSNDILITIDLDPMDGTWSYVITGKIDRKSISESGSGFTYMGEAVYDILEVLGAYGITSGRGRKTKKRKSNFIELKAKEHIVDLANDVLVREGEVFYVDVDTAMLEEDLGRVYAILEFEDNS